MERDTAFAAVPRLRVNFYFINEHDREFTMDDLRFTIFKYDKSSSINRKA
jgi:hypothetical protein